MSKKIIISIIVVLILVAGGGGFFWWWQNQKDVRELNKNLPEGVRVVKSLIGKEYKVVNKIDGYEFKVPEEWEGLAEIEYNTKKELKELEANFSGIGLEGKKGYAKLLSVDVYVLNHPDIDLEQWANKLWSFFELEGNLERDNVGGFNIVKAFEEKNLGGTYVYFLKRDEKIYVFNNGFEELLRKLIISGKW